MCQENEVSKYAVSNCFCGLAISWLGFDRKMVRTYAINQSKVLSLLVFWPEFENAKSKVRAWFLSAVCWLVAQWSGHALVLRVFDRMFEMQRK